LDDKKKKRTPGTVWLGCPCFANKRRGKKKQTGPRNTGFGGEKKFVGSREGDRVFKWSSLSYANHRKGKKGGECFTE